MVKFNLPQNSKIEVGKYYKDKTNSQNLKVNVYRWTLTGQNPRIDTFEVDMNKCGPKVLDILFKLKMKLIHPLHSEDHVLMAFADLVL